MKFFIKKIFTTFILLSFSFILLAQQDTTAVATNDSTQVHEKKGFFKSLFGKKDTEESNADEAETGNAVADTSSTKKKKWCPFSRNKDNQADSLNTDSLSAAADSAKAKKERNKLKRPKKNFKKLSYEEILLLGPDQRIEYYKKKKEYTDKKRAYKNNKIRKKYARKEKRIRKRYNLTDADKRLLNKGKGRRLKPVEQLKFNKAKKKASALTTKLRALKLKKRLAIKKNSEKMRKKNRKEFEAWEKQDRKRREKELKNSNKNNDTQPEND